MIIKFHTVVEVENLKEFYANTDHLNDIYLEEIDGSVVLGVCQVCGDPVTEDENCIIDQEDGMITHQRCEIENGFHC